MAPDLFSGRAPPLLYPQPRPLSLRPSQASTKDTERDITIFDRACWIPASGAMIMLMDLERTGKVSTIAYEPLLWYGDYIWYFVLVRIHLCTYLIVGWLVYQIYTITASTSGMPGTWW